MPTKFQQECDNCVPIKVFLVQDDESEVNKTKQAISDGKILVDWHVCKDRPMTYYELIQVNPDLIILDVSSWSAEIKNLVEKIRSHPVLNEIPIIILVSKEQDYDEIFSVISPTAFVTKPIDSVQLLTIVRCLDNFWFELVKPVKREKLEVS